MRRNAVPAGRQGFSPVIVIVAILILGAGIFLAIKNYKNIFPKPTPTPVVVIADTKLVPFVLSKLSLSDTGSVSVMFNDGAYAFGNVRGTDGKLSSWAAAKVNGDWNYLISGNGIPKCEDVQIFPVGLFNGILDQCYDASGNLIDRTKPL